MGPPPQGAGQHRPGLIALRGTEPHCEREGLHRGGTAGTAEAGRGDVLSGGLHSSERGRTHREPMAVPARCAGIPHLDSGPAHLREATRTYAENPPTCAERHAPTLRAVAWSVRDRKSVV